MFKSRGSTLHCNHSRSFAHTRSAPVEMFRYFICYAACAHCALHVCNISTILCLHLSGVRIRVLVYITHMYVNARTLEPRVSLVLKEPTHVVDVVVVHVLVGRVLVHFCTASPGFMHIHIHMLYVLSCVCVCGRQPHTHTTSQRDACARCLSVLKHTHTDTSTYLRAQNESAQRMHSD